MKLGAWMVGGGVISGAAAWLCGSAFGRPVAAFFWDVKSELFGGLFTLSGLLLSVKTYIVVKLHEGIYSKPAYVARYAERAETKKTSDESHLDPLRRLSNVLTTAVAALALSAMLQLVAAALGGTVGPIVGFGSAGAAGIGLVFCWLQIRSNLIAYFDFLKDESEAAVTEARQEVRRRLENPPSFTDAVAELESDEDLK